MAVIDKILGNVQFAGEFTDRPKHDRDWILRRDITIYVDRHGLRGEPGLVSAVSEIEPGLVSAIAIGHYDETLRC